MLTTKEKIIEATVDFFKEQAHYEQITLTKVAKRAEIGKSTVYEHFASKEDLIEETAAAIAAGQRYIPQNTKEERT